MSKEEAIAKLAKVFRQYGYEGATLSRLSQATGLKKASLYHYFPNGKEEMAAAVLGYMGECFQEKVLEPLCGDGEPAERISRMIEKLDEFYGSGQQSCLLAVLALGESKDLFNQQIQNSLQTWIEVLTEVLVEAGVNPQEAVHRAEDAIIQIEGALILTRALDNTALFKRVLERLSGMLLIGD